MQTRESVPPLSLGRRRLKKKTALLSFQPCIFKWPTCREKAVRRWRKAWMTRVKMGDGIEAARSNFPLSSVRVYTHVLTHVLYVFSVCIYTLFQLLPTISYLFSLSFFRPRLSPFLLSPEGELQRLKSALLILFSWVPVLSLTDETLGDITTQNTPPLQTTPDSDDGY